MIEIPNNWNPRDYQLNAWKALESGYKRAVIVWPRRAGKDATCENWTAVSAMQRVGVYWHMAPTLNQVRKIVWNNINSQGQKILEQVFPNEIVIKRHEQDMRTELVNGSIHQCVGSDNFDTLVGSNPCGVVFSEWSLCNPAAWDYIRPILSENGGWAIFPYTPRGANHGKTLFDIAQKNDDWFCEILTVDQTQHIPQSAIQEERNAGMSEEMIEQEFYCSFLGVVDGSYYGTLIQDAKAEGRVTSVPYDPTKPVYTSWDIGYTDSTAVWFWQFHGLEFRFIDYFESRGKKLNFYANALMKKDYLYGGHVMPHDAGNIIFATGKSIKAQFEEFGFRNVKVLPRERRLVDELGVQEVRNVITMSVYDEKKCARGLECLENYRRKWDEKNKVFSKVHLHDWTSHGADAKRTMALGRDLVVNDEYEEYEEERENFPQTHGWLA